MTRFLLPATVLVTAALSGCSGRVPAGEPRHETRTLDLDKIEMLRAEINFGAGELTLSGGSPNLLEADFTYTDPQARPLVDYRASSFRGDLRISQPRGGFRGGFNRGDFHWDLRLNDSVPTDLLARLGVGEVHMNAGSLNLRSVEVHMGVGELNLDLRGAPKRSYDVRIHGGVGEATIRLPKDVAITARASGGIGDIDVQGLEKRGGAWINSGHERDRVAIRVDAHGGIGEIHLIAE
jgi:hypothetical protein